MIEKEQWSPNNSPILSGMEIRIWYHPKPITVSELKDALRKIMKTIFAGSVNKAVLSFASSLTRVRER